MTPQLCTFPQSKAQLCTFEQSVALKHLGFNWKCQNSYYDYPEVKEDNLGCMDHNSVYGKASRPTISDAIRWFRIEKGLHGWVSKDEKGYRDMFHGVNDGWSWGGQYWDNHDDAENALLNRLIELTAKQP